MWVYVEVIETAVRGNYQVRKLLFRNEETLEHRCALIDENVLQPLSKSQFEEYVQNQLTLLNNTETPEEEPV